MLNRSAIKTGCTLLVFLLTSVGAFAETPFSLEDTQSNQSFLGGIAKGLWTKSFTNQAVGSLGIEAGSRHYRVDATLGLNLTGTQRLKVTSEYLSQAIDYRFLVGTTRQWVQQGAFGLDYQYKLTQNGCNYVDIGGYYSHAPNVNLDPVTSIQYLASGDIIQSTYFRHIAGSHAYGISPGITLNPWQGGNATFALNYDQVHYNTIYHAENQWSQGLGGTVVLTQQLGRNVQANLSAGIRAPFNTYQAGIKYVVPSGKASFGLIGNYTEGKDNLPNSAVVGIEFSFAFDKGGCKCGMPRRMNDNLNAWTQKPAVYMPQVLAIAEQVVTTTTIHRVIPTFSGVIPDVEVESDAEVDIPTASYFTHPDHDITFSAVNLATGLHIDAHTGVISGHTTDASHQVVITESGVNGIAQSNAFNITVVSKCMPPTFSGHIPTQYFWFSANIDTAPYFIGNDLIFSAVDLPSGLSIDPKTGLITGITGRSSYSIVVTATNSCGSAQSNVFSIP